MAIFWHSFLGAARWDFSVFLEDNYNFKPNHGRHQLSLRNSGHFYRSIHEVDPKQTQTVSRFGVERINPPTALAVGNASLFYPFLVHQQPLEHRLF